MSKKSDKKDISTFQWVGVSARGKRLEGELSGNSIALVRQIRTKGAEP